MIYSVEIFIYGSPCKLNFPPHVEELLRVESWNLNNTTFGPPRDMEILYNLQLLMCSIQMVPEEFFLSESDCRKQYQNVIVA